MIKHLVDIDETALTVARAELGTRTITETVNRALEQVGGGRDSAVKKGLDLLTEGGLAPREEAWRWRSSDEGRGGVPSF